MDKVALISMFITFATSNDVLQFEPKRQPVEQGFVSPPFCRKLDCPSYRVISRTKDYEEREYRSAQWVSTNQLEMEFDSAMSAMFRRLFRYISGANKEEKKIDMTAPVKTRIIPSQGPACESNFTMSFFVSDKLRHVPDPTDKSVYVEKVQTTTYYVRQFGGYVREFSGWYKEAEKLTEALAGKDYVKDFYYLAGYDSPFRLWNRHNEIWFLKK